MKRVSIVILNWNGKAFLEQFLPVLIKYSALPGVEIVIADNASTDGSVAFLETSYPGIRLIRLEQNFGFSGGYNRALARLDSKYFLLLNSDIEVTERWLEPLLELMEQDELAAVCTPRIRDYHRRDHFEYAGAAGGYIDRYGYPFCRGRIFDHVEADRGQYDRVAEVFWASGACLLVRAALFREAGGLDERFFAHMEEIDLCWRLQRMGYRVFCEPGSTVYHVGGGTLPRGNPLKTFLNFRNNLLLLYKNLPSRQRRKTIPVRMLLDTLSALRFIWQRSPADFLSVIRAHRAYRGLRKYYRNNLVANNVNRESVNFAYIYPGSIVVEFFLKGKKRFAQLEGKFRKAVTDD
ncbi:MAG TPA: glycosyltransferase family 2 protein [Bacteroides sp.]|nr:glycosyltransferase family 2 protein [Bacteroides sp.]